jgi:uncharacterized protein YdaU (DUF1376 family)
MNYYDHHIGDYDEATAHLTACEDGIYSRLIRKYMATEKALPIDVKALQRLVRARTRDEKEAVQTILDEFFDLREDGWHQGRCDETIARYQEKQRKAQASANARWNAQRAQSEGNANASAGAMRTHSEGNAHQAPSTKHQTPDIKQGEGGSTLRSEDVAGTPLPPDPLADRRGEIGKLMRQNGIAGHAGLPHVVEWAKAGITDAQLLTAFDLAHQRREQTNNPQPPNTGYVNSILGDLVRKTGDEQARKPSVAERRSDWNAELRKVIDQADGAQPREIDMGVIDATGTHD